MMRNNDTFWKLAKIGLTIGTILVLVGIAYATLKTRVDRNGRDITAHQLKLEAHEMAVVEIGSDVRHIREDIAEQKAIMKEIQKEIRNR
jgi:peptidoglycan hydrolase CwlO-like protein